MFAELQHKQITYLWLNETLAMRVEVKGVADILLPVFILPIPFYCFIFGVWGFWVGFYGEGVSRSIY